MQNLLQKNPNTKNVILLLVNRVALSRQNKFYLTAELKKLLGNEKYEQDLKYFTNEGIDELYLEFNKVTICTYHQCYKKGLLNKNSFKYIVCDECHFFTSDATFNLETDLMLEYIIKQGQQSIRVYMSATPEIALEPILKFEYDFGFQKSIVDEWAKSVRFQKNSPDLRIKIANSLSNPNSRLLYTIVGLHGVTYDIYQPDDYDLAIKKEYENIKQKFKFYYLPRNYQYLNFQRTYLEIKDLIPEIEKSNNKWIIFINSNSQAEEFKVALSKKVDCKFISRKSINEDEQAREEYDYIIENETFRPKVLIATSVIDNGINIKNDNIKEEKDKVLNIVVDATNRTQFLQMIGRVRASENDTINLYVKDYSIDDLKNIVKQDAATLTTILYNDFLETEKKQTLFDKKLFRYVNDEDGTFSDYNDCAVYQLINDISCLLNIIRNNEPDFLIGKGRTDNPREQVYLKYVNNEHNSWDKVWSRSIVDILESTDNAYIRKTREDEDLRNNVPENRFQSTIGDTLIRYLFSKLLVDDVQKVTDQKFQSFEQYCSQQANNHTISNKYSTLVKRQENKKNASLSIEEKIEILKQVYPEQLKFIKLFESEYKDRQTIINNFQWMADGKESSLIELQCKWLERQDWINLVPPNPIDELAKYSTLEEYIQDHHVTLEDFESNKCQNSCESEKRAKFSEAFLKKNGIQKDSALAKEISKKYFVGESFTNMLKKEWNINNFKYKLSSVMQRNDNSTWYIFVKCNNSGKET